MAVICATISFLAAVFATIVLVVLALGPGDVTGTTQSWSAELNAEKGEKRRELVFWYFLLFLIRRGKLSFILAMATLMWSAYVGVFASDRVVEVVRAIRDVVMQLLSRQPNEANVLR